MQVFDRPDSPQSYNSCDEVNEVQREVQYLKDKPFFSSSQFLEEPRSGFNITEQTVR